MILQEIPQKVMKRSNKKSKRPIVRKQNIYLSAEEITRDANYELKIRKSIK